MIDSGTFWRCDHGNTSFNGCRACMAASTLSAQGEAVAEVYLVPEDWGKHSAYLSIRATGKLPLAGTKLYTHAERARVPEGMVLVPREPTPEMRAAHSIHGDTSDWWNAVLAAAPSQPEDAA
jgi:hypothetical protein